MTFEKKCLYSALILTMMFGYTFALLQIGASSGFSPTKILDHFQGNEAEMLFGMDYNQLVKLSHIHMLGMPLIVTPAAWVFSQTPFFSSRIRGLFIVAAYVGITLDVLSWWGLAYWGAVALPALIGGGGLLGLSFLNMSLLSLKWLWSSGNQPS